MSAVEDRLRETFAQADARGFLHVRDLATGDELGLDAGAPVATASVIKIVFAIAFAREVAAGRLDPAEPTDVPATLRLGGSGTAGFADPVRISLRDLALLMLTVSDNAATDVIYARAGEPAIAAVIADLGLRDTHVRSDMSRAAHGVAETLGFPDATELDDRLLRADPAVVRALPWLDPATANASTPRDTTALLAAIWTGDAGPAPACAFVRSAMGEQVTTHRLAAGFADEGMRVAAKSGTLPGIRNEAGVVTYPDGRRFGVAVFTRTESLAVRRPAIDAAIGRAARLAVDALSAEDRSRSAQESPAPSPERTSRPSSGAST